MVGSDGCPRDSICSVVQAGFSWQPRFPAGDSCAQPGQICGYVIQGNSLPMFMALACTTSNVWASTNVCPSAMPAAGSSCIYNYLSCTFPACGGAATATCRQLTTADPMIWYVSSACATDGGASGG
jgi:hypothetical protein